MSRGRLISGILVMVVGIILAGMIFLEEDFPFWIGLFFIVIGGIILLNKAEDDIEQINQPQVKSKTKSRKKRK